MSRQLSRGSAGEYQADVVKSICDRMAVMENGRIVEEGNVYEVFADPQANSTRRFVGASFGLSNVGRLQESGFITVAPDTRLIRLTYGRESVGEALISEVSRIFNVNMSIILANVEILQDMPLGGLLIQASGDPLAVDQAIRYLEERNVKVEVILNGVA